MLQSTNKESGYNSPKADSNWHIPLISHTIPAALMSLILFQMLLSHPLFTGNPQLQQQIRQQIPSFLQQVSWLILTSERCSCLVTSLQHYAENKLSNLLCHTQLQWVDYENRLLLCNSKLVNVCNVDAELRGTVSHIKPQSHAGSAADPAGPSDPGCWGPWTDSSVSKDTVATLCTTDSWWLGARSYCFLAFKIIFDELPAQVFCRAAFQEGGDDLTPKLQPDSVLYSQSGSGPEVATVTEQQQQFVQQMLHLLANSNYEVCQCFLTNMCMPVILRSMN